MSSDYKLDIVTHHDHQEPGLSTTISSRQSLEGIHEQGNMSINNFTTNAERRALNDSMIMLNKIVLSSFNFNAGISLMFYQNLISTLVVVLLSLSGRISVEKLNWRLIISAVSGGITDLSFDVVGYGWQISNCVLTACYSLTLRWVMDEAKKSTKSGSLNEVSMVLLNNLLSLPFAIILILIFGEWDYVTHA
ncbi:hypothetical protein TanjilG_02914 [Lupinus angustifolius]|uniref:Sugar phosphate transporter domain-containing protein n=1 Tax=Lupinus angustifolius TaxID=3871 RepID=A0A1J7G5B8_LUPAN|nr:hypothetical protein TanjilG_02914 [Lupinus angustifolius]